MNIYSKSSKAKVANTLVKNLQSYFLSKLNSISLEFGESIPFDPIEWSRDGGTHGGGLRYEARDNIVFDRGSINVSQVHFDDDNDKKLESATAFSTIIHPNNPHAPSIHIHISWTKMRDEEGYWRVMADLNPSIIDESDLDRKRFSSTLKQMSELLYEEGSSQGNIYFNIPVLERHRGVSHYYLEGYTSGNFEVDKSFVSEFGESIIDTYISIISDKLALYPSFTQESKEKQLAYHTLYFFQVLTLDKGTTSGLLAHDQNDLGIMGSLPSHINKDILFSWLQKMPTPQNYLVESLLQVLPNKVPTPIDKNTKKLLAKAVRKHYENRN